MNHSEWPKLFSMLFDKYYTSPRAHNSNQGHQESQSMF